jgi:hypothetical protein
VTESTTPHSLTGGEGTYAGYGYMWWIAVEDHWSIPRGSYAASGYGGHTLEILPDLNTVIVVRINTDEPRGRLLDGRDVDRILIEILRACNRVNDPLVVGSRLLQAWGALVAGSLAFLLWSLVRDRPVPWGEGLVWATLTLLFGPIGALVYWLLVRRPARRGSVPPTWQRALGPTLCSTGGNLVGLLLLLLTFGLFVRSGNTGPLVLLAPLVVGWLGFRAPLLAAETGRGYWSAARKSLLVDAASTLLFSAGVMPVFILLQKQWSPYSFELAAPFFWAMHILAAFVGALITYPLHLWIAHRGYWTWPSQAQTDSSLSPPSLRAAWGTLLIGLISLGTAIGYIALTGNL